MYILEIIKDLAHYLVLRLPVKVFGVESKNSQLDESVGEE